MIWSRVNKGWPVNRYGRDSCDRCEVIYRRHGVPRPSATVSWPGKPGFKRHRCPIGAARAQWQELKAGCRFAAPLGTALGGPIVAALGARGTLLASALATIALGLLTVAVLARARKRTPVTGR
jgi:hypothetical protein